MKKLLLILVIHALLIASAHAQQPIYGKFITKYDSIIADGITYRVGDKLAASGSNDSATIKSIEQREYKDDTLTFAVLKGL